jgi:pyruvate formate lyase activating enzyme
MQKDAMLYRVADNGDILCRLCSQACRVPEGELGFCLVRKNDGGGHLSTLVYGDLIAQNVDPIEKKPLYHYLPGTWSYSVATVGCNFRCEFCQNWQISQVRHDGPDRTNYGRETGPEQVVQAAKKQGCASISYTYTEPTIFFEFAYDTAKLAHEAGMGNVFVTNGYMTRDAAETIAPYLDAANVDLKSFSDDYYKRLCQARLKPVLQTFKNLKELGVWVEATTLLVPGENDSEAELKELAGFLADLDPHLPWHISRFHPDYKFDHQSATPLESLERAHRIGKEAGLRYVYLGNVPSDNATHCPQCGETAIRRGRGRTELVAGGRCPSCDQVIAGVWS